MKRLMLLLLCFPLLTACSVTTAYQFKSGKLDAVIWGNTPTPRKSDMMPGNPWRMVGQGTFVVLVPEPGGPLALFSIKREPPLLKAADQQEILFFHDKGSVQLAFTEAWHVLDARKRILPTVYLCHSMVTKHQMAFRYTKLPYSYTPCTSLLIREGSGIDHLELDFEKIAALVDRLDLLEKVRDSRRKP